MSTKYCEDCKFLVLSPNHRDTPSKLEFARCSARENLISRNPPYGILEDYVSISRKFDHMCGPAGRFYVSRDEDTVSVSEAGSIARSNPLKRFLDWFRANWK